jgi:nitrate/TMAO reductase-like tetraheme cytochrome c subunit
MISLKTVLEPVKVAAIISLLALGFGAPVYAEDLSDNETCLDCHDDTDRAPPSNADRPQVHNPAGGFFVEDHADFSCIDCHDYIEDLEHEETASGNEVDCLNCHDEVPAKE